MTNALRPSELFASALEVLRAKRRPPSTVTETIYKGKIRPWGKTKGSLTTVPICRRTWQSNSRRGKQQIRQGLRLRMRSSFRIEPADFMDTGNYRKRVLHKLAEELGLPKLTFQVIRRTIATLAQKKGTVKDVQGSCGTRERPRRPMSTCRRFRRVCGQRSTPFTAN